MRIANNNVYEMVKANLGDITEALTEANRTIVSGKKLTFLSDDPVNLTQTLRLKSGLDSIEQMGRHINMGNSWLGATESALKNATENATEKSGFYIVLM